MQSEKGSSILISQISRFLGVPNISETSKVIETGDFKSNVAEVFREYFLPKILPEEVKEELTYFFLYKFYKFLHRYDELENILKEWWRAVRRVYRNFDEYYVGFESFEEKQVLRIRFASGSVYYPVTEILRLDFILGGKLLQILMKMLYEASKLLRRKIKVEDFCEMFWEASKSPYKLREKEVSVLKVLIDNPKAKINDICKLTHLSHSSVVSILRKLEEKQVFTVNSVVRFDKLGLKHIIVRIPMQEELEFTKELNRYLLSLQYVLGKEKEYLVSFVFPADKIRIAKKMLVDEFDGHVKMYEVKDFQFFTCLDYYDYNLHKWNIKYEDLSETFRKLISRKIRKLGNKKQKHVKLREKGKFVFDRRDLRVLKFLIRNYRVSTREVSRSIEISKSTVHKKLMKIKNEEVLKPRVNIYRVGLTEDMALLVKFKLRRFLDAFIQTLVKLPRTAIYKIKEVGKRGRAGRYLFWLTLPSGGTAKFLKNFSPILQKYGDFEALYRWGYYSWISFPDPELYDEEQRRWIW